MIDAHWKPRSTLALRSAVGRVCPALFCVSCAPPLNSGSSPWSESGFWTGAWHGFGIVGFLVYSLIAPSGIYAINNTGFGYNAGYVLGVLFFVGAIGTLLASTAQTDEEMVLGLSIVPWLAAAAIAAVGASQLLMILFALAAAGWSQ